MAICTGCKKLIERVHIQSVHGPIGAARFYAPCGHLAERIQDACPKADKSGQLCALGKGHSPPCVLADDIRDWHDGIVLK